MPEKRPVSLEDVFAELRALHAKLDALLEARRPKAERLAAELLPLIEERAGSAPFGAAQLIQFANLESGAALRAHLAGMSARAVGKLLRRLAEIQVAGGLVLFADGEDRAGITWRVARVSRVSAGTNAQHRALR